MKDTGVKKIFLLAVAPDTQENYPNILLLWNLLKINDFEGTVATDLKLCNILLGIMSHASKTPCSWCYVDSDNLHKLGKARTVQSIIENYKKWVADGANKKNAKNFKNCINTPIIASIINKEVLDTLPPPELHLMLGAVGTIVNDMLNNDKVSIFCENWLKKCAVKRESKRGASFTGNSCKKLLNRVNDLRGNAACKKYVTALSDLHQVIHDCF